MKDIEKAHNILIAENKTCVACKGDIVYSSEKTGIAPMLEFISENIDLTEFSVADKIVGKAAALLFVLAGIRQVYGEVMSQAAEAVLEQHHIPYTYGILTSYIINRKGDGICPMEETVKEIDDPMEAFEALCKKRQQLMKEKGNE